MNIMNKKPACPLVPNQDVSFEQWLEHISGWLFHYTSFNLAQWRVASSSLRTYYAMGKSAGDTARHLLPLFV